MADPSDKFDEVRRAWVARHQGWSLIQRRRAEQLGRRVRARQRSTVAALPDPHDDTSLPPLILRAAKSPTSQVELVVVAILAVCTPLGWLAGVAIKSVLVNLIPQTLRSFPIAALLWSGLHSVRRSWLCMTLHPRSVRWWWCRGCVSNWLQLR